MPQINDLIRSKLPGSQYNENVLGYLDDISPLPFASQINDAEHAKLDGDGKNINDRWWAHLNPPPKGSLNDKKLAFWTAYTP